MTISNSLQGNFDISKLLPSLESQTKGQNPILTLESAFKSLEQNIKTASIPENKPVATFGSYNMPDFSNRSSSTTNTDSLLEVVYNLIANISSILNKAGLLEEEKSAPPEKADSEKSENSFTFGDNSLTGGYLTGGYLTGDDTDGDEAFWDLILHRND